MWKPSCFKKTRIGNREGKIAGAFHPHLPPLTFHLPYSAFQNCLTFHPVRVNWGDVSTRMAGGCFFFGGGSIGRVTESPAGTSRSTESEKCHFRSPHGSLTWFSVIDPGAHAGALSVISKLLTEPVGEHLAGSKLLFIATYFNQENKADDQAPHYT
jgi:hypothetical protein